MGNDLQESQELATLAQKQGAKKNRSSQSKASSKRKEGQTQHLSLSIYQSRRLIAWQAREIIDTGALGRVLNTTIPASTSLWQLLPIKKVHINDPKVGGDSIFAHYHIPSQT